MFYLDTHFHIISVEGEKVKKELIKNNPDYLHDVLPWDNENHINYILIPFPWEGLNLPYENLNAINVCKNRSHIFPACLLDQKPRKWIEKGAVAIKEHFYGMRLASNDYKGSYRQIEQAGVPLITHLGSKGYTDMETFFEAIFARLCDYKNLCPELKIVLAHAGCDFRHKFWNPSWEKLLERINKTFPDSHVDISGLTDVELLKHVVQVFPIERILFGSDFPYAHPKPMIALLESFLDEFQKERIFYQNATELFNLSIGKPRSDN